MEKNNRVLKPITRLLYGFLMAAGLLTVVVVFELVVRLLLPVKGYSPDSSVMVTNLAKNSGGSGAIIETADDFTKVLTNAHVCRVVEHGGVVSSIHNTGYVLSYKKSSLHDLCVIKVSNNLGTSATISNTYPQVLDDATVIGHPMLMPIILTSGKFSEKRLIHVGTGLRACTPEELTDPVLGSICAFFGGVPVIQAYEAQAISALIQPGSSGSPVFDVNKSIAGVVFAGSGEMAFGYIVPLEYIHMFLDNEIKTVEEQKPNTDSLFQTSSGSTVDKDEVKKRCQTINLNEKQKQACKEVLELLKSDDLIYSK
jgi:S1-C subfamily serine protease